MLKPERMSKLFVVGYKPALNKVIGKLHDLKIAHIVEHKKDKYDLCSPLESFEKISSLLVQVRSLISHIKAYKNRPLKRFKLKELEDKVSSVRKDFSSKFELIKENENTLSVLKEQKKILDLMNSLNVSPENFLRSKHIRYYFGYINNPNIAEKLSKITSRFEIKSKEEDKKLLITIFVDSKFSKEFDRVLSEASYSEIDVSVTRNLTGNTENLLNQILKKQENLEKKLKKLNDELKGIIDRNSDFLLDAEKFLSIESEKAQIPLSFGSTKEAFFLEAYVPKNEMDGAKNELSQAANGKLYLKEEPIDEEEEVPIKLNNSKFVRNSEFFTRLFALPKYNEFDPSVLVAYTFPLFFGFMLGDVIYGLITFSLFYFLKKKFPIGKQFFNMMLAASVGAIIFGFLYGEFGGLELYHFWIERTHDFNTLMLISILAGVVHVNFGLMLGFLLEYQHHGFIKAATSKLSWIVLQIGGVLFLGPLLGMLAVPKSLFYAGIIIFIIAVLMLLKGEGLIGIMEMPSILTHIMSYARLMAVGLASVFIAVMVNDLVSFLFNKGLLFWPLALISLIVGHTFNIALGILSPSLHSIRLHYVEFFSKFYQGGGAEYEPFGAEKQKSLI